MLCPPVPKFPRENHPPPKPASVPDQLFRSSFPDVQVTLRSAATLITAVSVSLYFARVFEIQKLSMVTRYRCFVAPLKATLLSGAVVVSTGSPPHPALADNTRANN